MYQDASKGFSLANGFYTRITINKEVVIRQPHPYSNCRNQQDMPYEGYKKYLSARHLMYDKSDCIVFCSLVKRNETCKGNKSCEVNFYDSSEWANYYPLCDKNCPWDCFTSRFRVFTSLSRPAQLGNNVTKFSISYENMSTKRLVQSPKQNFGDLVSSIGGTMSCFLGASLLSFIEGLDLIIEMSILFGKYLFRK